MIEGELLLLHDYCILTSRSPCGKIYGSGSSGGISPRPL